MLQIWGMPRRGNSADHNFDEIFGGVGRGTRNSRLDFGGDPDQDQDPRIFKGFFIISAK